MQQLIHYIDGKFQAPLSATAVYPVINPANETCVAEIRLGGADDADLAVRAARRAFDGYSMLKLSERVDLLKALRAVYMQRYAEMVDAIITEMGAPRTLSHDSQAECGPGHISATLEAGEQIDWEHKSGGLGLVVREAVGVCGLITPWNWPMNQVVAKSAPALLAGCTVILKPSEQSPLSAQLWAEFVHAAGYPAGVFNMVHGTGPVVGHTLSVHPEVDLMSFTGSTRAGIMVAKDAADTVKRVHQELGGKSANIVFADADLEKAVKRGVVHCFSNTGQSCNAPTRMLVEASVYDKAVQIAVAAGQNVLVDDPMKAGHHIGPLASKMQFEKVQGMIQKGIDEGAQLVLGGVGRPAGLTKGYYVKPTIFAGVNNHMAIAREEIFGPVLVMIPFKDYEDAIAIANDTPYGLAAYVQTQDWDKARRVARRLRAGSVYLNGIGQDYCSPFGGFKQSGNGREWGKHGLLEFLELKSINGFYPPEK
jgi:aldehyde dehydrogenase (NAD+)